MYRLWLTVLALMATVGTAHAELPANATLLDPDIVWDISDPDCATISPDGKLVAYISKGAIWICSVNAGPPTRIAELPDTSTAFMAMPKYEVARTNFKRLRASLGNATYNESIQPRLVVVSGLQWTPSQDGVMFGLSKNSPSDQRITIHMLMHASIKGVVTALATIERGVYESRRQLNAFHVTKNKELAIVWNYNPLIWGLSNNRPRATGFDYLLPSTTSDRFLGVEIDTRQLVATDENLRINKRFDVTFAPERGCDLFWSSDERFAICRSYTRAEYPKNEWTGLRLDLKTGEKRLLSGDFVTDRFAFTGRGGEVVRSGIIGLEFDHLDAMRGAYLEIVPDGDGPPQTLARFTVVPKAISDIELRERPRYPRVLHDPAFNSFAMALPRASKMGPGYEYRLLHRDGKKWTFPNGDAPSYIAPYYVIAFANDGRTLVAHNDSQLFSIPVAAILDAGNQKDE